MTLKHISLYLIQYSLAVCLVVAIGGFPLACGGGSEADDEGVGAECTTADDCDESQECLAFKGGYCGIEDCVDDDDCPDGSFCVTHDDGIEYCFLECTDKPDCNVNRTEENESNCVGSGTVDFVEAHPSDKVCVPPEGS